MAPRPEAITFGGIYAIRHVASGKFYVGSAADIARRWADHRRELNKNAHCNRRLQNAWNKYGAAAFVFEILRAVDSGDDLFPLEQEHLDYFQPWRPSAGYNIASVVVASMRGRRHSAEAKAKLSAAHKGRKQSPEWVAKRAATQKGRKATPELRARFSAAQKRRAADPAERSKRSAMAKGRTASPGTRAKLSAALKGREFSPEHRAKLSEANRRRQSDPEYQARRSALMRSPEYRAKLSEAVKGKKRSPESIAKSAAALRGRKRPPEAVAKMIAAANAPERQARLAEKNRSPEMRAKVSEGLKKMWAARRAERQAKIDATAVQATFDFDQSEFRCEHCGGWHIGHRPSPRRPHASPPRPVQSAG
jgi:group I intron endonuclease